MIIMEEVSPNRSMDAIDLKPISSSKLSRFLWMTAGTLFLVLGLIGIILPLLPATPFLLLAAACYIRGSQRMYRWMLSNKLFGRYLRDYREGRGLSVKIKIGIITLLWITIGITAIIVFDDVIIRVILIAVAIGVTIHVLTIRPKRRTKSVRDIQPSDDDSVSDPD